MAEHYDVLVIGSGAGGGTLAYALAQAGRRVLLLERGEYIPREKQNWDPKALFMDGRYRTEERWLNPEGDIIAPNLYHRVGGSTKIYGSALLRMRTADFEAVEHYGGVSPAWPIAYEQLAPYYDAAEALYWVHGRQGEDPTEPPRSGEFPYRPLPHEPVIAKLAERLQRQGLRPFSLPMGIRIDLDNPQSSPCIRCDTCDGFPCLLDAKADAQVCCVDPAIRTGNLTLLTGAEVQRLVTNASGSQVRQVEATVDGELAAFSADIVAVSCGAVNSAALLLRSASDAHPYGLGNGSGQVGRNLMKHNTTKLYAIDNEPNPTVFQKTLAVNDFYLEGEDGLPLGHVHLMGKHKWQMMRPDLPSWLPQSVVEQLARYSVDWWVQSEDLPDSHNRITVAGNGQIQMHYRPTNLEAHHQLLVQFRQVMQRAGFRFTLPTAVPHSIMNHQCGTCRFGEDPEASVLDTNCRSHEVDNLYVVDSSFFPSSTAINPSLTIVANALRVAEHLRQRLGAVTESVGATP